MLNQALFSQSSYVSEREHSKFRSNLQRESPDEIHLVLSLIIPSISSFAAGAMVVFIQNLNYVSSYFRSVLLLLFQQNHRVYLRLEMTSGDARSLTPLFKAWANRAGWLNEVRAVDIVYCSFSKAFDTQHPRR